jgi:hypothetical protein
MRSEYTASMEPGGGLMLLIFSHVNPWSLYNWDQVAVRCSILTALSPRSSLYRIR